MRKEVICFVVFLLAWSCIAFAIEFKASIYSELAGASLNSNSALNPDNIYDLHTFRFYNRGTVTVKNTYNDYINSFITLESLYIPQDIFPDRRGLRQLKVKELCVDLLERHFTARIGKQYLKWGGGTFFNPSSDILNHRRNPLRPLNEAEGNRFVHITAPVNNTLTAELIVIQSDENGIGIKAIEDIAVLPKISFSHGNLSGFLLAEMQKHAGPLYGTALEYAYAAGEYTDLALFIESQLKTYTQQYRVVQNAQGFEVKKINGDSFFLFVAGARLQHSFAEAGWLDGVSLLFEYNFDEENWNHNDYKNYINYLRELQYSNMQSQVLSIGESFKNSRHYIYSGLLLHSFFIKDFYILNSAVVNLGDSSIAWIPDVYYMFANQNATVGMRSYIFSGNSHSEFGSSPLHYQIMGYLELSF
jgi:hypothetical protein